MSTEWNVAAKAWPSQPVESWVRLPLIVFSAANRHSTVLSDKKQKSHGEPPLEQSNDRHGSTSMSADPHSATSQRNTIHRSAFTGPRVVTTAREANARYWDSIAAATKGGAAATPPRNITIVHGYEWISV